MSIRQNPEVRALASKFVDDLTAAVEAAVRQRLLAEVDGPARPRAPSTGGKSDLAQSRAAARKVSDAAVLGMIEHFGAKGVSAIELGKRVRLRPEALSYRLVKLRAQKKIRSTGRTSKMLYFTVKKAS